MGIPSAHLYGVHNVALYPSAGQCRQPVRSDMPGAIKVQITE